MILALIGGIVHLFIGIGTYFCLFMPYLCTAQQKSIVMKVFRFFLRYWAAIGGLIFVGLAFLVGIQGHQIPTLQRYMILMYMALLFHQFE